MPPVPPSYQWVEVSVARMGLLDQSDAVTDIEDEDEVGEVVIRRNGAAWASLQQLWAK